MLGIVNILPDVSGLAGGHPRAVGRHPGGDDPAHRHQRRPHRRVATGLLPGAASPGAAVPRPRAPQAAHAVRVDHRVRGGGVPPILPGSTAPARRPLCLRRDDLVHRRARVRDRLRIEEPDLERPFRTPVNIPVSGGRLPVLAVDRRPRHVHACGASSSPPMPRAASSASSGWAWARDVRDLPQSQGLLAYGDRREGRGAGDHAGRTSTTIRSSYLSSGRGSPTR